VPISIENDDGGRADQRLDSRYGNGAVQPPPSGPAFPIEDEDRVSSAYVGGRHRFASIQRESKRRGIPLGESHSQRTDRQGRKAPNLDPWGSVLWQRPPRCCDASTRAAVECGAGRRIGHLRACLRLQYGQDFLALSRRSPGTKRHEKRRRCSNQGEYSRSKKATGSRSHRTAPRRNSAPRLTAWKRQASTSSRSCAVISGWSPAMSFWFSGSRERS